MKNHIVMLYVFLLLSAPAISQQLKKDKLDSLLNTLVENEKFMGSVSIAKNGKSIYSRAVGHQNVEGNKNATLNTIYNVGSITKMFTATLVFKAVEAGKLSLDAHLDEFFPSIPHADQITIEQMLGHKSGIFNITSHKTYHEWNAMEISKADMIAKIAESRPVFDPGSDAKYSNSNYILLTYILEDIFGLPYVQILDQEIRKPVKLKNTFVSSGSVPSSKASHAYRFLGVWEKMAPTHPTVSLGAGFIHSTPEDLIKFQEALLSGKLISKQSLAKMMTFQNGMGYGMFEFDYADKKSFGHTGSIDGFYAFVAYQPEDRISIAMASNGMNFSQNEMVEQIYNTLYAHDEPLPKISSFKVSDAKLDQLSGIYSNKQAPIKISVSHKNGFLLAQASGQGTFLLEAESPTVFKHPRAGIVLEFGPDTDKMMLKQGGKEMTFAKE